LVVGGIVDDDHMVVGVVLLGDGVEVEEVAEPFVVFVGRHHHTHR